MDLRAPAINQQLDAWINEDLGRGDLTKDAIEEKTTTASWITNHEGVFCGGELVEKIYARLDEKVNVNLIFSDGDLIHRNDELLTLRGPSSSLLAGERTALNIAMHLSGIATATQTLVKELEGTNVKLADTRKTTPGLRVFEKYAFQCGGGTNHRLGLDDAAMIKENHLAWSKGDLEVSIGIIRSRAPWTSLIIVEAETAFQAEEALKAGADGILLDEMSINELQKLIPHLRKMAKNRQQKHYSNHVFLEASGVDPSKLKGYASTGVDFISTSAPMTRSHWLDFSMRFTELNESKNLIDH